MKRSFTLGEWQVEPELNQLTRADESVRLQPQQMDLLCRLAAEPRQVVSRDTLIDEVWRRGGVNDEVLSRSIAELRSALGDQARKPRYVETIPRRGYRLLLEPRIEGMETPRTERWLEPRMVMAALVVVLVIWLVIDDERHDEPVARWPDPAMTALQVTSLSGQELDWAMDQKGRIMAYVSYVPEGPARLMLRDSAFGEDRVLVEGPSSIDGPSFSPDGRQLAWVQMSDSGCSVMLQDLKSATTRPLADCWAGGTNQVQFSPDGRSLAFSYATAAGAGIGLLDMATEQVQRLTTPPGENRTDLEPRFSPSGDRLSFSRGDRVTRELFVLKLDSNEEPRQLTRELQLSSSHTWVGDSLIVFASDRQARQALWMLSLTDGEITALGAAGAYGPYYNLSLETLYYEQSRYRANIWTVDLTSEEMEPEPLIESSRYDNHPVFSPDGQTLAFVSNRSGLSGVWLARADGSQPDLMYEVPGARVSRPTWSADGSEILVSVYGASGSHLVVLDLTGQVQRLLVAGNRASAGEFGPEGRYLYYLDERNLVPEVWRLEYRGQSSPGPFASIAATRIQTAVDGMVYYTRPEANGIYSVRDDGSDEQVVIKDFHSRWWNHWCIAGNGLYYPTDEAMVRYDLVTGERRIVSELLPRAIGITVGVDPAETRLLISRTESAEVDIMATPLTLR